MSNVNKVKLKATLGLKATKSSLTYNGLGKG